MAVLERDLPVRHETTGMRRWPLSLFEEFQTEMDRMWNRPLMSLRGMEGETWMPRMDTFRKGDEMVFRADLPGLRKEDVEITIENDHLVLKGERKLGKEVDRKDLYRNECTYGTFFRTMTLPPGIDTHQIRATFEHGVLEVHVPMPAETQRKVERVKIK